MPPDRLQLGYIWGSAVTYPPGATFGPRTLHDFELVWIVDGQVTYHVDGQDYPARPGAMILGRPGFRDAFTWDPRRPTRHAYFHFELLRAPSDWPPIEQWPIVRLMPDDDVVRPLFRYALRYVRRQREPRQPIEPMLVRSVETLLGAYITGPVSQASELDREYPEPVKRAIQFVQVHLADRPSETVTLPALAKAASVSQEHLCRLFRTTFGVGPIQAVRLLRLDMALMLLARSNLNVEQIAERTGFSSAFHFSRRFRETYGMPPTKMRARIAAGEPPPVSRLLRHMPMMR